VLDLGEGFDRLSPNGEGDGSGSSIRNRDSGSGFGIGRFRGQSTNSPSLRLALWVLRFATQQNCDLTPKTGRLALPNSLSNGDLTYSNPI
jgi:hypothetical protein